MDKNKQKTTKTPSTDATSIFELPPRLSVRAIQGPKKKSAFTGDFWPVSGEGRPVRKFYRPASGAGGFAVSTGGGG